MSDTSTQLSAVEQRVRRKFLLRLVPLLFGLYAFFSLDRGNVGLAALRMNADLGMSESWYGLGGSLFTAAYLLCQIPAASAMRRIGASRGLAAVAVCWGIASTMTAFVWNPASFLVLRSVLGIAEAGFGSFIIYYVGQTFPRGMRGVAVAATLVAVPLTMVIASPISGGLLTLQHAGLRGWQWLFIIEGAPAVLLGLLALVIVPDRAEDATFLDAEERAWLAADLAAGEKPREGAPPIGSVLEAARSGTVWVLGLVLFAGVLGTNTLLFWMPQIVKQMSGAGDLLASWLNALPWLSMALGMMLLARVSDRTGKAVAILSLAIATAAVGFVIGGVAASPSVGFVGLLVGAFGVGATMALFWAVPLQRVRGPAAAGAFAAINMIGNSSGIFAHGIIGWLRDTTGQFGAALIALAAVQVAAALVLNVFERRNLKAARASERERLRQPRQ